MEKPDAFYPKILTCKGFLLSFDEAKLIFTVNGNLSPNEVNAITFLVLRAGTFGKIVYRHINSLPLVQSEL